MTNTNQLTPNQVRYIIAENFPIFDTDVVDTNIHHEFWFEIPMFKHPGWGLSVYISTDRIVVRLKVTCVVSPILVSIKVQDNEDLFTEETLKHYLKIVKERIWHFGNSIQHTYLP